MREVLWTVDSRDWTGKTAAQVARFVIAKSRPRSLVLMHMSWNGFNPATLARIKTGLAGELVLQPHLWGCASGGVVTAAGAGLMSSSPS